MRWKRRRKRREEEEEEEGGNDGSQTSLPALSLPLQDRKRRCSLQGDSVVTLMRRRSQVRR